MRLVETVPWQAEIVDAPPVRLDYEGIEVPEDVDFTYIGSRHSIDGGEPDYLEEVLGEADVFVHEQAGWTKELARRLQGVADGRYSALKDTLKQVEWQKQLTPGLSAWNEVVYRQLYESGVRVVLADYSKDDPSLRRLDKVETVIDREGVTEVSNQVYAERDKFIIAAMCGKIKELRGAVPDIAEKSPLRVVALYGAMHYGVHDALAAAAEEQGVTSFSSRLLFEESAGMVESKIANPEQLAEALRPSIDYQNWLRTEPEATSAPA